MNRDYGLNPIPMNEANGCLNNIQMTCQEEQPIYLII